MASSGGGAQVAHTEQNIFTISFQGARRWVDFVTENTSQLTGCSLSNLYQYLAPFL